MDARTKEAIRYLGYGRHAVDDHTLKLVERTFPGGVRQDRLPHF